MTESPERPVACSACGHSFDPTQPRQACPQCGSDRRRYEVELSAEQKTEGSVVAHKPEVRYVFDSDGGTASEDAFVHKHGVTGTEGVRVERGGTDPRSASADIDAAGTVEDSIGERASPKERSELRAAQTLVQHLNARGSKWESAELRTGREDGVDCTAAGQHGAKLEMQMTTPERSAWPAIARGESFDRQETTDEAAESIWTAIAHKKPKSHRQVTLVIDAADSPRYALKPVADRFRELYARQASEAGFASVWLVGPVVEMVYQLDV